MRDEWLRIDGASLLVREDRIIVLGDPPTDSAHNCDAMECSSLEHVLVRTRIPEWQAELFDEYKDA